MGLITWIFQSTRPSRASTYSPYIPLAPSHISIHKALAGLDLPERLLRPCSSYFNPQGPRGPRQHYPRHTLKRPLFQSTRPSRASTKLQSGYFNPQGPRGPRRDREEVMICLRLFQSTRPSRASTFPIHIITAIRTFQSTRPSRASTRSKRE